MLPRKHEFSRILLKRETENEKEERGTGNGERGTWNEERGTSSGNRKKSKKPNLLPILCYVPTHPCSRSPFPVPHFSNIAI